MKHKLILSRLAFVAIALGLFGVPKARAQGVGSVEAIQGLATSVADTTSSVSETLFIGPGTYTINGYWKIYSKYIWVSPNAVVTGSGNIQFFNASVAGGTSGTTYLDANTTLFDVNMELQNGLGITMADMTDPGWGGDSVGYTSLHISKDFNFAIANGNFILGSIFSDGSNANTPVANTAATITDFIMDNTATLTGYQPSRMFVTSNSIKGHVVRMNYTGSFTFPIGIAAGDYTPVNVNNTIANTIHASVQDYTASASNETTNTATGDGMARTWNIYADNAAGNSNINLQHNTVTNQGSFNDAAHFITQWSASAPNNTGDIASGSAWQSNTVGSGTAGNLSSTGTVANSSMRNRSYATFATSETAAEAYFSKSSNTSTPLPLQLLGFDVKVQACKAIIAWQTAVLVNFSRFELEYSPNGKNFSSIQTIYPDSKDGNYSVNDYPANGDAFYRLKMMDNSGHFGYSDTRFVKIDCSKQTYAAYPNPTNGLVHITGLNKDDKITISDMNGKRLLKQSIQFQSYIDLSSLSAGFYNIMVENKNGARSILKVTKTE